MEYEKKYYVLLVRKRENTKYGLQNVSKLPDKVFLRIGTCVYSDDVTGEGVRYIAAIMDVPDKT